MKTVNDRVEEQIDIRSIVHVKTSLDQLVSLLLTKDQRLLFNNQIGMAIPVDSNDESFSSSSNKSSLGK